MRRVPILLALCAVLLGAAAPSAARVAAAPAAPAAALADDEFAPYLVPPRPPRPHSSAVKALLRGSGVTAREGWIVARLAGSPYRIGFQNGYYTAQSADYWMRYFVGEPGSAASKILTRVARDYMWRKVPVRYQRELRGIRDGMRAAGYPVGLWRVVAANGWADVLCYAKLLPTELQGFDDPAAGLRTGGCSAFIATGAATADHRPVAAHTTWTPGLPFCMFNVMYQVRPDRGFDLSYQSAGGQIWSGMDWYENGSGLLLTETSLPDSVTDPRGTPVFSRVRKAAQFSDDGGRRGAHAAEGQQRLQRRRVAHRRQDGPHRLSPARLRRVRPERHARRLLRVGQLPVGAGRAKAVRGRRPTVRPGGHVLRALLALGPAP